MVTAVPFTPVLWLYSLLFVAGYLLIIVEHLVRLDKAAIALLMGCAAWALFFYNNTLPLGEDLALFSHQVSEVSQIVLFLLGALAIVEVINAHNGFAILIRLLRLEKPRSLLWAISLLTFALSSVLDNLTTTIVMVSLVRYLLPPGQRRLLFGGAIVIAANAGGAWTPIGDVTTTMLWIGGQVSSIGIMKAAFLPSIACCVGATAYLAYTLPQDGPQAAAADAATAPPQRAQPHALLILTLGVALLIFVPLFKMATGLPPFMGILFGLAVMWLVTDRLHGHGEATAHLRMSSVFANIDLSSILFFVGILLCVGALQAAGLLAWLAGMLEQLVPNKNILAYLLGLFSAVVDNVPLVASSMAMFPLELFPTDATLWSLMAFCAGTGGSILVIGSAAGVVFMGMEKVTFTWYLRYIAPAALLGYLLGIALL